MLILPQWIYRLNAMFIKIPARFFVNINKVILKCIWKSKWCKITQTTWKKKNTVRGPNLHHCQTRFTAAMPRSVRPGQRQTRGHVSHWNRQRTQKQGHTDTPDRISQFIDLREREKHQFIVPLIGAFTD